MATVTYTTQKLVIFVILMRKKTVTYYKDSNSKTTCIAKMIVVKVKVINKSNFVIHFPKKFKMATNA